MAEAPKAEPTDVGSEWKRGDGLLESVNYARQITFKGGFVRVRAPAPGLQSTNEGRAEKGQKMTFDVPAHHTCEVLGGAEYQLVKC
jgi:hypothetical protein